MKKSIRLLSVLLVLFAGCLVTGCMIQDALQDTHGQWYKYNKTVDIPLGKTGEEDEAIKELKGASLYVYYETDIGLKVAIQAETKESVEVLGGLFSQDVDITAGAVYDFENFTDTKWAALVLVSGMAPSTAPAVYTTPEKCLILGGEKAKETKVIWKKVLAEIILKKLLGE